MIDFFNLEDLPTHIVKAVTASKKGPDTRMLPLDNAEAETIRATLSKHVGSRKRTAAELGISRNTLWRKMKRYGIE